MSNYNLSRAKRNASKIGVTVKPSKNKGKKLDVFRGDKKLASIGDVNYADFTKHQDKQRQKNYMSRHGKTRVKVGTPSYFADRILWR